MTYHVAHRYGAMEWNPSISTFVALLAELDLRREDTEHGEVAVTHESEWCISVLLASTVVLENLEHGEPRHMKGVSKSKALELWCLLAEGMLTSIEQENWLPGYG